MKKFDERITEINSARLKRVQFKLEKATPYSKLFVDWGKEKEFGIK